MIEFRLGDASTAPSEQVLATWQVDDELVAAICTGINVHPIVPKQHREAQGGRHCSSSLLDAHQWVRAM